MEATLDNKNPFGKLFLYSLLLLLIVFAVLFAARVSGNPQDPFDKCQKKNGISRVFYNQKLGIYARVCEDKGRFYIQQVTKNAEGFWEEVKLSVEKTLDFPWARGWVEEQRWMAQEIFNFIQVLK